MRLDRAGLIAVVLSIGLGGACAGGGAATSDDSTADVGGGKADGSADLDSLLRSSGRPFVFLLPVAELSDPPSPGQARIDVLQLDLDAQFHMDVIRRDDGDSAPYHPYYAGTVEVGAGQRLVFRYETESLNAGLPHAVDYAPTTFTWAAHATTLECAAGKKSYWTLDLGDASDHVYAGQHLTSRDRAWDRECFPPSTHSGI